MSKLTVFYIEGGIVETKEFSDYDSALDYFEEKYDDENYICDIEENV